MSQERTNFIMKTPSVADKLTPHQAQYVLSKLIRDRVVSARHVHSSLSQMETEIRELENRLEALKTIKGSARGTARPSRAARGRAPRKRRASPNLSPEVRASRALQGKYISTIKQIPKTHRPKFKKIAEAKGREEAIRQMEASLKK